MRGTIYYNGDIITMESQSIKVEAILVKDGKITKIGTKDEVLRFKRSNTKLIDLQGKTLMPSFIDAHSHITSFANTLNLVQLSDCKSFEDIINKLKEFKSKRNLKDGEWIIGFGYDNNSLIENNHPTKVTLDKASSKNPILIAHASGHMGVTNTLGLKAMGITSKTKNPEGGIIGHEPNSNEPNGYLEENAFIQNSSVASRPSLTTICELVTEAQHIYLSYGITTAQEGIMKEPEFNILRTAASERSLILDIIGYVDLKHSHDLIIKNRKYVNNYINKFKIGGYKIFLDGSPQGRTAWLTEPYENGEERYCGYPIYTDEEVKSLIDTALSEDLQLLSHCNGDAAADQLLNVFKSELPKYTNFNVKPRPGMIHAQTVRYDQIDEMKKINMIPSYFVAHTYFWGDVHIKNLGIKRASRISPVETTIKKGVPYTLHQDTPVILPDMLLTVWCAVNRLTKNGVLLGENERVSPYDALKGVTINAAYQYFEEDIKGSIKEGKLADLIILDKNPMKVDPLDICNIKVLETIKEGNTLYRRV